MSNRFREWDYDQLISSFCFIREKPLPDQVKESVIEELKKLNYYGWENVCKVAESVMMNGKYALNEKLWLVVRNEVSAKINELKGGKPKLDYVPKHMQSGFNLPTLTRDIDDEILLWLNHKPPLKYHGHSVVRRASFYVPEVNFDIEIWNNKGRPELETILNDQYFGIFHDSITKEEVEKVDGILLSELNKFLERLQALRTAQVKVRTDDYLEKRRADSATD